MKENGGLEELLHRHRGMGLVLLCVLMIGIGSLQMDKAVIETGSEDVDKELPLAIMPAETGTKEGVFTGTFVGDTVKVQEILEILKRYHTELRMVLHEEKKDGYPVKWFIEYLE